MSLLCRVALSLFALALLPVVPAQAADVKAVSPAVCQPYSPGKPIDPSLLHIRADGIFNYGKSSQYVICPIPKDADEGWTFNSQWRVMVHFEKQDGSNTPTSNNACSLYVGTIRYGTFKSKVKAASSVEPYGPNVLFSEQDGLLAAASEPATLVCVIAPSNILEWIELREGAL